jgi:hypothetical protein
MPLVHASYTVGTSAVVVVPHAGEHYHFIAVANSGTKTAYLKMVPGDVPLSVTNGVPLPAGAAIVLDQDATPILVAGVSAVCAGGESTTVAAQAY